MSILNLETAKKSMEYQVNQIFGLEKYCEIQNTRNNPLDKTFQRNFNSFYRVRRDFKWQKTYYELFNKYNNNKTITFSDIINALAITNYCEASFSSKMLATINPSKPILDSQILKFLDFKITGKDLTSRIESSIKVYSDIENWYKTYLTTKESKECLTFFDKNLPQYKHISNIKKIDCFIWGNRINKSE